MPRNPWILLLLGMLLGIYVVPRVRGMAGI